ncbi:hypothetical protein ACIXIP_05460 [Bacteroides fragilis]
MHFKTTESGATAHICTDKKLCGDGRESQTGENTGLKAAEKDGRKLKKRYYVSIYG